MAGKRPPRRPTPARPSVNPGPVGDPTPGGAPGPSFGRWMGSMWAYTLLRYGLFAVFWVILWLLGVQWLLALLIAAVLSVPLSYVLLAKPRARFAATIEQRIEHQRARRAALDTELDPDADRERD